LDVWIGENREREGEMNKNEGRLFHRKNHSSGGAWQIFETIFFKMEVRPFRFTVNPYL
jgi:hypothetical protein